MAKRKKKNTETESGCENAVQTERKRHPYFSLSDSFPSRRSEMRQYELVKDAVPVIGAAIDKLTRLIGTFRVVCADKNIEKELNDFLGTVRVGSSSVGINSFISSYFSSLLTYGTAVGEIVTDEEGIRALYNTQLDDIELSFSPGSLDTVVCVSDGCGGFAPVRYPELIFVSTLGRQKDSPYGISALKGLPYIADILLKIYNTIGVNWERTGNVRYAVTYKPQNDTADKTFARQRAKQVAEQWSRTMESGGPVRDFVAVGDVDIRVIGADGQIPDSDVPVRQMLEQIVAKLGVPPFLLGLSWSSTERMSAQQADILTSEIEYYREVLNPVITKICSLRLRFRGLSECFSIEWNDITLQDSLSLAQTNYYNAQAENIRRDE